MGNGLYSAAHPTADGGDILLPCHLPKHATCGDYKLSSPLTTSGVVITLSTRHNLDLQDKSLSEELSTLDGTVGVSVGDSLLFTQQGPPF